MLNIRLQRTGKRGQAHFRIVVVEHTKKPRGKYLELLGSYNPHEKQFTIDKERVEYWLSKGAQITPTLNNLMVNYKVWDQPKMQTWKPKKQAVKKEQVEKVGEKKSESKKTASIGQPETTAEAKPEHVTQEQEAESATAAEQIE